MLQRWYQQSKKNFLKLIVRQEANKTKRIYPADWNIYIFFASLLLFSLKNKMRSRFSLLFVEIVGTKVIHQSAIML